MKIHHLNLVQAAIHKVQTVFCQVKKKKSPDVLCANCCVKCTIWLCLDVFLYVLLLFFHIGTERKTYIHKNVYENNTHTST